MNQSDDDNQIQVSGDATLPAPIRDSKPESSDAQYGYSFETLVSAGPRKDQHEYDSGLYRELGEDAAGLIALPGMTLYWLSDGTSDEALLPGFSARLLAQDAGSILARTAYRLFREERGEFPFEILIRQTFQYLLQMWQARADERWQLLQQRHETEGFLQAFDLCHDGWLRKSWSATFVAGRVIHSSGLMEAINLGDGTFLVHQQGADVQLIDRSKTRLWLCVEKAPDAQLDDLDTSPLHFKMLPQAVQTSDILSFEAVQWILCMTDGATSGPIHALVKANATNQIENLAMLFKGLRQKTYDDRTLILGRRLGV